MNWRSEALRLGLAVGVAAAVAIQSPGGGLYAAPEKAATGGEEKGENGHGGHGGHGQGHGPLVHRFTDAASWAKKFDDPARDAWQRPQEVVALLGLATGMTAVDLGAGTGYFLPYLSRAVGQGGKVWALDIEESMVRYMRERARREKLANVEARQSTLADPQLAAGSADRILIVDVWHHVPERARYAAKLREALRPGGAVYVVDFTMESKQGPPKHHRLTPEQVMAELKAGGLETELVKESLPEQYVVAGRRP